MNIIKFNDVIKSGDCNFNCNYRGKYCWWVNCKWAVPFTAMTTDEYVLVSQADSIPDGMPYIVVQEYQNYVDEIASERINNQINICKQLNGFVDEIPLDKLKVFRTWLAQALIEIGKDIDDDEYDSSGYGYDIDTMLNYYAHTMFDDTVKALTHFSPSQQLPEVKTGCNCNQTSISTTQLNKISCNALDMYKNGMHNKMVETFSDIDFWVSKSEFCILFRKYIDGILKSNLPLSQQTDINTSYYCDCTCLNSSDSSLILILTQLSQALQYIIDGDVINHKNFIYQSLYSWSSKLYETMYWV